MRGLIVSLKLPESRFEAQRIDLEARALGMRVDWVEYEELVVEFQSTEKYKITWMNDEMDFGAYDWAYFRPSHYGEYGEFGDLKTLLLMRLKESGVRVPNLKSQLLWPHFSKAMQYALFSEQKIPVIHSWQLAQSESISIINHYPLIIKKTLSSMGSDVFKVENEAELMEITKRYGWGKMLVQDYIRINEDYRVMVVNRKAEGIMCRQLASNSHLTNISAGGKAIEMTLTAEFAELAERVARICSLDHCGVDILRDGQGKLRVLEVNRFPQFQGFEKITGINVAKKIIEYLVEN